MVDIPLSTPPLIPSEASYKAPPSSAPPEYAPEAAPPPYTPAKHEPSSSSPIVIGTAAESEAQVHHSDDWRRRSWRVKICGIPCWFIFVLICSAAIVGGVLGYRADQARKNPKTVFAPDYWYTISDDYSTQPQYLVGDEAGQSNVSMIKPKTSSDVDDVKEAHWQIKGPLQSLGDWHSSCFDDGAGNKRDVYWIMNRAGGHDFHLCFREALLTPEAIRNRNSTSEVLELELSNKTLHDGVKQRTGMWYFDKRKADGKQAVGESFRINNCASREDWILGWETKTEPWRPVMVRAERKSRDMWWRVWKLFAHGVHVKIEDEGFSTD